MKAIRLVAGKERTLAHFHPWVFESSIKTGRADAGELVRVEAFDGTFLAWGAYSPTSKIRVRAWSFDQNERIDESFFAKKIAAALKFRSTLKIESSAKRLIHAETDGLPALIVDQYNDTLVVQFGAMGVEHHKKTIVAELAKQTGFSKIYERSDANSRSLEGLEKSTGWLMGPSQEGEQDHTTIQIKEHSWQLKLNIAIGHKTGFYLDQCANRKALFDALKDRAKPQKQNILNCYCYSGGFGLAALAAGAENVISVDSSADVLALALENTHLNGFETEGKNSRASFIAADVNKTLRAFVQEGRRFDVIVLDPPKFAPTSASADRAARAYKDINRLALLLLNENGLLFTFSCSGAISPDLFHKIVAGSAMDAGVNAFVSARLAANLDHPLSLYFPEGDYLKGLVLQRI